MQSAIPSQSALTHNLGTLPESVTGKIVLTVAASVFVAVCAHVYISLPFTPVPLTLQNFAVLLVGMFLGPVAGFSAMVLYLAEGAMGLPVFSPQGPGGIAQLLGPTAGYLFAYPLAAAAAGWAVRSLRQAGSVFTRGIVAGIVFSVILFTLGAGWLSTVMHLNATATWYVAVAPFLLGEVIKVTAAAGLFSTLQRWRQA